MREPLSIAVAQPLCVPYDVAAMMIIFTAFIVGVFYCLDALYGERRDRTHTGTDSHDHRTDAV